MTGYLRKPKGNDDWHDSLFRREMIRYNCFFSLSLFVVFFFLSLFKLRNYKGLARRHAKGEEQLLHGRARIFINTFVASPQIYLSRDDSTRVLTLICLRSRSVERMKPIVA